MGLARGLPSRGVLGAGVAAALLVCTGGEAAATPPIKVPWPCGVTYRITQGHNTGSHTGNGAWAWDIGIPVGGEVAAPAAGTVRLVRMDSTTGGCSDAYGNDANYVVIEFGDGTEALFLHLEANSTSLQPGDPVAQGDIVGRVGLTGWVCGAHLHFQIQQTCASWWCPSVAGSFQTFGDPAYDTYIESDNCGGPPPQCGVRLAGGTHIVDEQDASCFDRVTSYWWSVPEGHDGHHWFTFTTDEPTVETWGRWRFGVDATGQYELSVHIPDTDASAQRARYLIDTGLQTISSAPIDQSTRKGWVSLGTYTFAAGDDRSVVLNDNTGENYDQTMRKLAYDAVRLTWVASTPPGDEAPDMSMDTAPSPDTSMSADTSVAADSQLPPADTMSPAPDGMGALDTMTPTPDGVGAGDTATADSGGLTDGLPRQGDTGCACDVRADDASRRGPGLWALVLVAIFAVRRRRRSTQGR